LLAQDPTEDQVLRVHEELIRAQQRKAGAIDTQENGIGIGKYAKGSIPARSPERDFTEEERTEINRLGYKDGCHTCGTRNPGTPLATSSWITSGRHASIPPSNCNDFTPSA
jgi:hypothetical protein